MMLADTTQPLVSCIMPTYNRRAFVPQADVDWARNGPPLSVAWTPDGAHVLFSGSSGKIHDYPIGSTASAATEQPASASFTVVGEARSASPSPPGP